MTPEGPKRLAPPAEPLIRRGGNALPADLSPARERPSDRVAPLIDHTLLRSNADRARIETLCAEARQFGFASVCVNPVWVPVCAAALRGCEVSVCTVIGFPLGATRTPIKATEAERARALGAREIDVVMNLGAFRSGAHDRVLVDLREVRRATGAGGVLKVILETGFLSDEEKRFACDLAIEAGADYVKTSTGFGPGGASVHDIRLLSERSNGRARVKASGGIRTLEDARALVAAGASRLGTSAGVAIARAEAGTSPETEAGSDHRNRPSARGGPLGAY